MNLISYNRLYGKGRLSKYHNGVFVLRGNMPKRMVDTELWNNEDIIETFTAEDRYFWLYLLTNPHNSICGVMKASSVLIARDMGYSKECIQNLLYRFENVHKAIYLDKETKELVVLNWWKFNWTKSKDLLKTITKNIEKVQSQSIKNLLFDKIGECFGDNIDGLGTVLGRSRDGTNTNTNTIKEINKDYSGIDILNDPELPF